MKSALVRGAAETGSIANVRQALAEAKGGDHDAAARVVRELAALRMYVVDKYSGWDKEPPPGLVRSVQSLGQEVLPFADESLHPSIRASLAIIGCKTVDELNGVFHALGV